MVGISCAILSLIFICQRFGTARIGFCYAPILALWFSCNAAVGIYNIAVYYPSIFRVSSLGRILCSHIARCGLSMNLRFLTQHARAAAVSACHVC